ncbi:alpha-L-Rha alpha-1,3-L-rhamnosyltransferase [Lachnospiraceae bacterium KM106-2]|nr:alpha-L-Rha alpha-1,3-L-rhamnosyltransferase [Lachnospiraceae bacterium KM106-2]
MSQITIIMAVYNGQTYLKEQIESILANSYQDFQLIICDDGSTDDSVAICKQYEQDYPGKVFSYVNEKNLGVRDNFLMQAKNSETPYVMFCDQDDKWLEDKIEKSIRAMEKMEKKYGVNTPITVYGDAIVTDSKLNEIAHSFHQTSKLDTHKVDLPHLLMENKLIGCTMILNRALVEKLDTLPKDARMHDWWIGLIASAFGKIGYIHDPLLLYRQHEKNVVGNQSFVSYVKNRISNLGKQKDTILATIAQAEEFKEIYDKTLSEEARQSLTNFIALKNSGFIKKRRLLLQNGFLKSGLVRNIGLFVII